MEPHKTALLLLLAQATMLVIGCSLDSGIQSSGTVPAGIADTAVDDTSWQGLDSSETNLPVGFFVPDYATDGSLPAAWVADLSVITDKVINAGSSGSTTIRGSQKFGYLLLDDSTLVHLNTIFQNPCPDSLVNCAVEDSDSLGIGHSALVIPLESLPGLVRSQGSRGTCVAFAWSALAEILLARQGVSADLSEQYAYFEGRRISGLWDSAGLNPESMVAGVFTEGVVWVDESAWPYNPEEKECSAYWTQYPDHTCSATEAQGGGTDGHEPDPQVLAVDGHQPWEAHQLYASLGRVKQALYRGYPVLLAINANLDFSYATRKSGVVTWSLKADACAGGPCGHAIAAVGYQDDDRVDGGGYVIVLNSWGTGWGDGGLAYLSYEWLRNSILDAQALVAVR